MRFIIMVPVVLMTVLSCQSQTKKGDAKKLVGGPCQGCEAVFEYDDKKLSTIDTLPGFQENEPKLKISGTVFKRDGKTPAENVVLYIYQTDRNGVYPKKGNEKGWGKRHGYIRGWVKTDRTGNYTFYTFRPAAYPNGREPQHIHFTVKEPTINEYYIDDVVFEDDPMLTQEERNTLKQRGGSGIVTPVLKNGLVTVHRDIILGLNIPNYE